MSVRVLNAAQPKHKDEMSVSVCEEGRGGGGYDRDGEIMVEYEGEGGE